MPDPLSCTVCLSCGTNLMGYSDSPTVPTCHGCDPAKYLPLFDVHLDELEENMEEDGEAEEVAIMRREHADLVRLMGWERDRVRFQMLSENDWEHTAPSSIPPQLAEAVAAYEDGTLYSMPTIRLWEDNESSADRHNFPSGPIVIMWRYWLYCPAQSALPEIYWES